MSHKRAPKKARPPDWAWTQHIAKTSRAINKLSSDLKKAVADGSRIDIKYEYDWINDRCVATTVTVSLRHGRIK